MADRATDFGNGIFYQSLGQGLAAAASMYATLSMQGKELKVAQTDADARKMEAETNRLKVQKGEDAVKNQKAMDSVASAEEDKAKANGYGDLVIGQSMIPGQATNTFSFKPNQSLIPNQSLAGVSEIININGGRK